MRFGSSWVRVVPLVTAGALLWSACGTDQAIEAEVESSALSCHADRQQIIELLRSGLPTYDYEPASDLAALVEASDVVLAGTIGSIGRVVGDPDPDSGDDSWTVLSVQSPELLHAPGDVEVPIDEFSYTALWPDGAGVDPLAAGISIEGLAFVAFLDRWEPAPGTHVAAVQGLVVDCVDGTTPTPVIEPLPGDAAGLSLTELARAVDAIGGESVAAPGSGVDGPLLRHLAPETADGEAAEIVGTLELEDDCLYLRSEDGGERYPIVWPKRTRWDSGQEAVILPNGDHVGMTDRVSGGGGYHGVDGVAGAAGPEAAALAERCLDNAFGEVAIVNNQQDGIRRAGGADQPEVDTDQSGGVTVQPGPPLGERQNAPGPGEVKLWVSNQSLADDPIHLTVAIGDLTVVDQRFEVLGQHNWIAFDIRGLQPGVHTITAESDTGASLTAEFTVPEDEPRWLLLDYWYYPEDAEGRHFTFDEFDEPVAFA